MATLIRKTVCQKSWKTELVFFFSPFYSAHSTATAKKEKILFHSVHIIFVVGTAFCPKPKSLLLLKASITSWKAAAAIDAITVLHIVFFAVAAAKNGDEAKCGKTQNLKEKKKRKKNETRTRHKFKFEYAIARHCNAAIKVSLLNVNCVCVCVNLRQTTFIQINLWNVLTFNGFTEAKPGNFRLENHFVLCSCTIFFYFAFRFVLFGFSIVLIYISYLVYFYPLHVCVVFGYWYFFHLSDKTFAVNVDFQLNATFCSIIGATMNIHSHFLLMPKILCKKYWFHQLRESERSKKKQKTQKKNKKTRGEWKTPTY